MKITKLKRGWRINLTDTEMEILQVQVQEGFSHMTEDLEAGCCPLSPAGKRIMTEIHDQKREWVL